VLDFCDCNALQKKNLLAQVRQQAFGCVKFNDPGAFDYIKIIVLK
jgi:hypothetical protein